jgi:hypothetical protein
MARLHINYSAGGAVSGYVGIDPETPVVGFYRMRLRSGGAPVGVRIWFGAPLDPVTGEEMDRSHRFQAQINGAYAEMDRVWPRCAGEPIDQAEYRHLMNVQAWAEQNAPDSAFADPTKRIDVLSSQNPLPF